MKLPPCDQDECPLTGCAHETPNAQSVEQTPDKREMQVVAAVTTGSVAGKDPRIGGLSREDALQLKAFAESIGAMDCMPAWMAREIEEKTSSTADREPQNIAIRHAASDSSQLKH